MHTAITAEVPGQAWRTILSRKHLPLQFAADFTPGVELHTSVTTAPIIGAERISAFLTATTSLFATFAFVRQTDGDGVSYLDWDATMAGGMPICGVTAIERDADGLIARIRIVHHPLQALMAYSARLAPALAGKFPAALFYQVA
jgi:hypothetical protein